jgi:hypothetical protein
MHNLWMAKFGEGDPITKVKKAKKPGIKKVARVSKSTKRKR